MSIDVGDQKRVTASPLGDTGISIASAGMVCLTIFLTVALLKVPPFGSRSDVGLLVGASEGDFTTQLVFMGLFAVALSLSFMRKRKVRLWAVPLPFTLLLLWFGITLFWSPVPELAVRRLGLTAVVAFTLFTLSDLAGPARSLRALTIAVTALTLGSLLAGLVYSSGAIHQPGDPEASIIGAWRGLFYHKNQLGAVACIATLIHFCAALSHRGKCHWLMSMLCLVTLVLSQSKSSMVLSILCIVVFCASNQLIAAKKSKYLVTYVMIALILLSFAMLVSYPELAAFLDDPQLLTGRIELWHNMLRIFMDNPLAGFGYGSIFQTGASSPLNAIANTVWGQAVAHAHNGYLEVLATTGIMGGMLLLTCVVLYPGSLIWRLPAQGATKYGAITISLLAFSLFHNVMESGFGDRSRASWIACMLSVAILTGLVRSSTFGNQTQASK